MRLLTATVRIYVDAAREAGKALPRSAWAFITLLLGVPVLFAASLLVAPLGVLGGVVYAFVNAVCAGTYLAMLKDTLGARRGIGPSSLRDNFGSHTWDVLNVLFPLFLVRLLLGVLGAPSIVFLIYTLAIFVFLNPVPELIGRSRASGLELLREAMRFMMRSGPEWLAPQVIVLVGLWLAAGGGERVLLAIFGAQFRFTHAADLFASGGWLGWALGFGALALVHLVMLFRGALYERLSGGGRRAREWEERLR